MLFPSIQCDAAQRKILDSSEYLMLTNEEQVNFHFMAHLRNVLKAPDFMASFERRLLQKKFQYFKHSCPYFAELDYNKSYIELPKYSAADMTPELFQTLLKDPTAPPIVIKGLISDSVAVKKWSHQYLRDAYGNTEIMALQYDKDGSYQAAEASDSASLTLGEIIRKQLEAKSKQNYYVNNSAQIFNEHPGLLEEIGGKKILQLFAGHSVNTFSQLFVGNVRTWGTNWHQGNDLSAALMINGAKRWCFVDPRLVYILEPYLNGPNGMLTKAEIRHALDFQVIHNPLYAYAPKFTFDMEPGDALIFTKYWPHAVVNISAFQIMANMRMTEVDIESLKKGYSTANLLPVFDNILNSDPEFIRFKFEIFQGLGKQQKKIDDNAYFSAYAATRN